MENIIYEYYLKYIKYKKFKRHYISINIKLIIKLESIHEFKLYF